MRLIAFLFSLCATPQSDPLFAADEVFFPVETMYSDDYVHFENSDGFNMSELSFSTSQERESGLEFIDLDYIELRMIEGVAPIDLELKECYTSFFSKFDATNLDLKPVRRFLTKFIFFKTLHIYCGENLNMDCSKFFELEKKVIQRITSPEYSKTISIEEDRILEDQIIVHSILYNILKSEFLIHPISNDPPITKKMLPAYAVSLIKDWNVKHLLMSIFDKNLIDYIAIHLREKKTCPDEIKAWLEHLITQFIQGPVPIIQKNELAKIILSHKEIYETAPIFNRLYSFLMDDHKKNIYKRFEAALEAYKENCHVTLKDNSQISIGLKASAVKWFHSLPQDTQKRFHEQNLSDHNLIEDIIHSYCEAKLVNTFNQVK